MFTPHRLFGEAGLPPDTLTHEPFLERARVQREQDREASARLALGGYVIARLIDNLLLIKNDPDSREAFRWQLHAVRRHIGELPGDSPETAHLSGIVAGVPEHGPPPPSLWMSLTAYAYYLEHEARLDEALETLMLAVRSQGQEATPADFAAYALFAGRLNRQLARWDRASACYNSAEEAALTAGDPVCALRSRLGRGAVQRGLGNLPLARELAEAVVRDASELQLADVQSMAHADLGAIYALQGLRLEELQANYDAFRLTSDSLTRMRILGDLGIGLLRIGAYEAARLAFRIVIDSNAKLLVRANALLELMDLESCMGNRVAFERCRSALTQIHDRLTPSLATDYQYKLGTGLARFGQIGRAREALAAGLALAETHRLNVWYFKIEQELQQSPLLQGHEPRHEPAPEPAHPEVVNEVMLGLREYAAAAEA
ncbi:MAG TPA: tetratricopeptide repeat protein [Gemmatimonadales bacterium]|nr:tetratricopeptide repeat protein [Gemmatimonadales bacterium]